MENGQLPKFSVSDFVASINQTFEYAYPSVVVEGEVESFKVSQGKFVFFTLKDSGASVGCFMMVYALRTPLEDGMKVLVRARPKLTQFGKFSLTIETIQPVGAGSIKRGFELLKAKLEAEGLFGDTRKRVLPSYPRRVGVVSSMQSAGYADFMKIADARWGGVQFDVYHVPVQGSDAPDAMISAISYFNQHDKPVDVLVLLRGGGSADDLAAFNDEALVRAIAGSRIPTLVGVGHEVDVTLSDMVADVRAATPSNAAQLLLPDKSDVMRRVDHMRVGLAPRVVQLIESRRRYAQDLLKTAAQTYDRKIDTAQDQVRYTRQLLESYDPNRVLARGYALVRGEIKPGAMIDIETHQYKITAEVRTYEQK